MKTLSSKTGVRVGVVGGGFMGAVHSRAAISARGILVGVASSTPERAASAAERLGFEKSFASAQDMFDDPDIDVVHICAPNTIHAELALAALAAGKHVICEKPLATTAHDAGELVHAAELADVTATVPFIYRYHPMVREAKARIANGQLGTLLTIQGTYLQDWLLAESDDNWRVDRNVGGPSRAFADIGSHLVDLIEFVTGDKINQLHATKRTVFSERARHSDIETEDAAALTIVTNSGAIGTLLVSQVAPGRKNHLTLEVSGKRESILFDQEHPDELWIGRRSGTEILARDSEFLHSDAARLSTLPAGHPLGYQDAFNAFIADSYAAAAGERHDGLPNFVDGLRAAEITEAVLESAQTGKPVAVPDAKNASSPGRHDSMAV